MEELPHKRIKLDSQENAKAGKSTVTQSSTKPGNSTTSSKESPSSKCDTSTSSHLQFNPSVIERLRKITKEAQKNFPSPQNENTREESTHNGDRLPVNGEATEGPQDYGKDNDVIVSSTGSSPAHSPKLSDLKTLSTPPRLTKCGRGADKSPGKFCANLLDKFEEVFPSNEKSSGSDYNAPSPSVDKRVARKRGQHADAGKNGSVGKGWGKSEPVVTVVEEKPTAGSKCGVSAAATHIGESPGSSVKCGVSAAATHIGESPGSSVNFNSFEFQEIVKKMLQEKMTQMVSAITEQNDKYELKQRMAMLERENRALQSYASKLEETVKQLLAEQRKRKGKVSRGLQTDTVVLNTDPPTPSTLPAAVRGSPVPTSSVCRSNNVDSATGTTTRVTSTVAPLPGHTVPVSHPVVAHTSPYNTRSISAAQPQVTRAPAPILHQPSGSHLPQSTPTVHRQPAAPNQRYPSHYQASPQVQPAPPPRSHPPTVTVRPQAQPPSPGAQRPFHRPPPPYGYAQSAGQIVSSIQMQPRPTMAATAPRVQVPRLQAPRLQASLVQAPRLQAPRLQASFVQAPRLQAPRIQAPRVQAPRIQGPRVQAPRVQSPRVQLPRVQGPRVQNHASYMVRAQSPTQQHLPPYPHQEPNRLQSATGGQPPLAVSSLPPTRPALPPTRPTLPPARLQPPLTSGHPSAAPINPPAQQQMVVCAPPVTPSATPGSVIQVESRTQGSVAAAPVTNAVQQNGDGCGNESPPKPTVSIAVVMSGIVLSWNMSLSARHANIVSYQLFALQDGTTGTGAANQWKKIGVVKALPLPMACTLTQFLPGNKYHFAVRASDSLGRAGPFSEPCTITLK